MKIDFSQLKVSKLHDIRWEYVPESLAYQTTTDVILQGVFGFCGCGSPKDSLKKIYDGLMYIKKQVPAEVDDILLYVFDKEGLTEHGVSVWGSWLSDYGKQVLRFMEEYEEELL